MTDREHLIGTVPAAHDVLPGPTRDPGPRGEEWTNRPGERLGWRDRVELLGLSSAERDRMAAKISPGDARGYRMRRLLALSDALAVLTATALCVLLDGMVGFSTSPPDAWAMAPFAVFAWIVVAGLDGMFHVDDRRIDNATSDEIFRVTRVVALWVWVVFAIHALTTVPGAPSVTPALALGTVAIPAILIFRDLARLMARHQDWFVQRVVIVGSEADRDRVRRTLVRHPEYGLEIVGQMEPRPEPPHEVVADDNGHAEGIAGLQTLVATVIDGAADRVIFASPYSAALDERTGALRYLSERGVKVDLVPGDSDVFRADAELHHIEGLPLITMPSTRQPRSAGMVKRALDIGLAATGLALLSPLFALAAVAIKVESRGPVFFRQRRIGRDRQAIEIVKFRTMVANAEELKPDVDTLNLRDDGMFKIPEDPRITRVGGLLRKYSLDELPQLLNVLRGEMSLVGPRPLIQDEADRVEDRYSARFNVRPGITGPWQVLGRSDIPLHDMVKLDYTYVTNWSMGDDLKLLVRTVSAIAHGRGAY